MITWTKTPAASQTLTGVDQNGTPYTITVSRDPAGSVTISGSQGTTSLGALTLPGSYSDVLNLATAILNNVTAS